MTAGRAIVQAYSLDGALEILDVIKSQYLDMAWTEPVRAADGSYLVSIHYDNKKQEVEFVDSVSTRIL